MQFNETRTFANLMSAFAGESQARNKYTYHSAQAKKDGYTQISKIFEETAKNECAHAKIWFDLINSNGTGLVTASTLDNLEDAAGGEHFEWSRMYAEFAKEAKDEGFEKIGFLFEQVAAIEKDHETRYRKYIDQIKQSQVFSRPQPIEWKCENCGHEQNGTDAPGVCPVCGYKQGHFADEADMLS